MKKIKSALISVFYKDGLEPIAQTLQDLGITIYSTGGTEEYLRKIGIPCISVASVTAFPEILGGRVKTLHPSVFGGILGRRHEEADKAQMEEHHIPEIDLVIVDLYPFEETVQNTTDESLIIEKIDIGGPSMIRAAAKNHRDVVVVASKEDYPLLGKILHDHHGETSAEQRRFFAIKAFDVCTSYDLAISNYFHNTDFKIPHNRPERVLRYGENSHQHASFYGDLEKVFKQLHGKELSYNNLADIDAAILLLQDFTIEPYLMQSFFAIIKHTNACGVAVRNSVAEAWDAAYAGDPESAFGGVLATNTELDANTANAINEIFFEVIIATSYSAEALRILQSKKNRIILQLKKQHSQQMQMRSLLKGLLVQQPDQGNVLEWKESGGRETTPEEKEDLLFANIVCKHLKSNAIAIVKSRQLIGKGCGQTSRIDALRQALNKSVQFNFDTSGAVLASDAFFPFDDCVRIAAAAGVACFIQPGGSIRDADSVKFCQEHKLPMIITGMRHFRH